MTSMAEQEPSPVQLSALRPTDNLVTIKVGSKRKTYHISAALLTSHSDYFRNTLQTYSKGSKEQEFVFEDLEPLAFDVFVSWLHTGTLPQTDRKWLVRKRGMSSYVYDRHLSMLRLMTYVVADRVGARPFRCLVNNQYVEKNFTAPWLIEVIYGFKHIPHDRPVLNLFVHWHCKAAIGRSDFEGEEESLEKQLPQEFLLRVMDRYKYLRNYTERQEDEEPLIACDYHEHNTEEERKECRRLEFYENGYETE